MGAQQSRGSPGKPITRVEGGNPRLGRIPSGSGAPRPIAPGSGMAFTGAVGIPQSSTSVSGDVKPVFGTR
jgi:hypothetical protein